MLVNQEVMIKLKFCWFIFVFTFQSFLQTEGKKLPSLWRESDTEFKSYRIMAELEITQSGKVSVMFNYEFV